MFSVLLTRDLSLQGSQYDNWTDKKNCANHNDKNKGKIKRLVITILWRWLTLFSVY
jgi:hypothetical protein